MKPNQDEAPQMQFLMPDLGAMLDARQPLYQLAGPIEWGQFESVFSALYKEEGWPALPIDSSDGGITALEATAQSVR